MGVELRRLKALKFLGEKKSYTGMVDEDMVFGLNVIPYWDYDMWI